MGNAISNLTGGLLGESDDQFHAKQANQMADTANKEGATWRNQAGNGYSALGAAGASDKAQTGGYGQLAHIGQQESSAFTQALPGLVSNYENTTGANATNPYALTDAETTELNGQVDQLNQRQNSAIQNYHAEMARRGIDDPASLAAGEAQIRQGFGGLISNHSAAYADNAKTQRQNAQMTLLNFLHSVGQSGTGAIQAGVAGATQEQEAGAGGLAGLGAQASSVGNAQTQIAQQYTANNQQQLSSLLQLGGYAAGGGFGGGGGSADAAEAQALDASSIDPYARSGYYPVNSGTGGAGVTPTTGTNALNDSGYNGGGDLAGF